MESPLVSVVIPAFNAERFIKRALASALGQTAGDLEAIVVDDGSRDRTAEIVRAAASSDARVLLVTQENGGVSRARNRGCSVARGRYIAPLDHDDLWHPTKLEKQLACFAGSPPETGVVYCHYAVVDAADRVVPPRRIYHAPTGYVYPQLVVGNIVGNASSPLIRREALEAVGGYDESFRFGCEDLDLYLRLAERSDYALVPEFLVGYRRSSGSMSMNIPKMERAIDQLTRKTLASNPHLPRHLLRWRDGNLHRYLALHALMGSDYLRFLMLAGRSAVSDPLLLYAWFASRVGTSSRSQARPDGGSLDYLSMDPAPTASEAFRPTPIDRRRHAVAARIRRHHSLPA